MYILVNRDSGVRLSEADGEYKQFWKQICLFGEYVNPNGGAKMVLDEEFANEVIANFESGKYGVVSVPLGHPKTDIEMAEMNRGEVLELKKTDDGIEALIEIRDDETVEKIEKRLIPDVSMGFSEDYLDKKTGKRVGALLKHVGLVVDPYIKGMTKFVACSEDNACVLFSDKDFNEKGEEVKFVKVKNDRKFDIEVKYQLDGEEVIKVIAAGEELEVPEDEAENVEKQITDAEEPKEDDEKDGELADDNENVEPNPETVNREAEVAKREAEIAHREQSVAWREREIARKEAEAKFNQLLSDGKAIPAQKEAFLALSELKNEEIHLSDESTKTVDILLAEIFDSMPDMRLLSENGAGDENDEGGEVELTEEELVHIEKYNLNKDDYIEAKKENK